MAEVGKVLQFENLTPQKIGRMLDEYGEAIGIGADARAGFFEKVKNKKYVILIWLKNPHAIAPFEIDKAGFGLMAAWLCAEDVERIKIK